MGYYDQGYDDPRKKESRNKRGYFLASLAGLLLGAVLVIASLPVLSDMGLLPYVVQTAGQENGETPSDGKKSTITQNVSLNVKTDITEIVDKVADAVVGISNIQSTSFWGDTGREVGTGSGVIYKKAGNKAYIVTNYHVIEGAHSVEVTLLDGTKLSAEVLGGDIWTDLAVLAVDGKNIDTVAEFGDSDALKVGEPVIAIGNPLGATFSGSVTQGSMSGLERAIPVDIKQGGIVDWQAEVIQTDAAINPGNSGGALINIGGQLIGINSMKIATQAVEGIGLAIPINYAIPVIEDLEKYGEVKRPYMGIELQSVNEIPAYYQREALNLPKDVNYGVAIRRVEPGSPADKAGLKAYDVIVELDGEKINDVIDLRRHLYIEKKIGDNMTVKFYRNGKLRETTMKLTGNSF